MIMTTITTIMEMVKAFFRQPEPEMMISLNILLNSITKFNFNSSFNLTSSCSSSNFLNSNLITAIF